jgi:hypothetical protein
VADHPEPLPVLDALHSTPAIVARTREVISRHGSAPPLTQPTREQLLTTLDGAG